MKRFLKWNLFIKIWISKWYLEFEISFQTKGNDLTIFERIKQRAITYNNQILFFSFIIRLNKKFSTLLPNTRETRTNLYHFYHLNPTNQSNLPIEKCIPTENRDRESEIWKHQNTNFEEENNARTEIWLDFRSPAFVPSTCCSSLHVRMRVCVCVCVSYAKTARYSLISVIPRRCPYIHLPPEWHRVSRSGQKPSSSSYSPTHRPHPRFLRGEERNASLRPRAGERTTCSKAAGLVAAATSARPLRGISMISTFLDSWLWYPGDLKGLIFIYFFHSVFKRIGTIVNLDLSKFSIDVSYGNCTVEEISLEEKERGRRGLFHITCRNIFKGNKGGSCGCS